jgi:hypothetical protein
VASYTGLLSDFETCIRLRGDHLKAALEESWRFTPAVTALTLTDENLDTDIFGTGMSSTAITAANLLRAQLAFSLRTEVIMPGVQALQKAATSYAAIYGS